MPASPDRFACAARDRRGLPGVVALVLLFVALIAAPLAAEPLAVDVVNESEPTLCAESDNVFLNLASPEVRRFTVEARHPAYVGTIVVDRAAPDFTRCDFANPAAAPPATATPRRITIYESEEWQLVGHVFPSFWRSKQVPVQVGDRVERGLHLVQLWKRHQERAEEILVVYPPDGYWRARPLPPPHLRWTAYGSSFLVGPVEIAGRPLVDLDSITFDPATRTFRLVFARGGTATLRLDTLDDDRIALDVTLAAAVAKGPFAALRSMYVTEINADVTRLAWRGKDAKAWSEAPVMDFARASAVELWTGRTVPSRHNTSAPDMLFRDFAAGP
jgi:hypothetical protein